MSTEGKISGKEFSERTGLVWASEVQHGELERFVSATPVLLSVITIVPVR